MNKLLYIICVALAVGMASCSGSRGDDPVITERAALVIDLNDNSDVNSQEQIRTIRFLVFSDVTRDAKLNVNEYIELPVPGTATGITATTLAITPNDDIMVVVVVNEPQTDGYSLKAALDAVMSPWRLEEIVYDIAQILNSSNGQILESTGMPMVGVIRDISVVKNATAPVRMTIERAVARVDIYLEAIEGGATTGYTAGSSTVTLHNITYGSYFAMGNEPNGTRGNSNEDKNYGYVMKNVSGSSLKTGTWVAATTPDPWTWEDENPRRLLCSFYTAERIFATGNSDRLAVSMTNIKKETLLTGVTERYITTVSKEGVSQPFTEIRRNNVYEITAKVGRVVEIDLAVTVESWGEVQDIEIIMNP